MKLFYSAGSPYARIVRVALIETGLADKVAAEEAVLRDPSSPLLAITPSGRVPALQLDNGEVLSETLLVLSYLDTLHDGAPLLPRDGSDGWRSFVEAGRAVGMLDGIAVWNRELRRPENERSPGIIAHETARANRIADALEPLVADGAYSGAVDGGAIALACTLGYCERRHTIWPWRDGRPALSAWYDRLAARPSLQATQPPPSAI